MHSVILVNIVKSSAVRFMKEGLAVRKRVITANRLVDGAVVWRDRDGYWREKFDRAAAGHDDDAVARMLADAEADAAAGIVIAPYEVEVDVLPSAVSQSFVPIRLRERVRAFGPTVAST